MLRVNQIVTVLKEFRLFHNEKKIRIKPGNLCVITEVLTSVARVELVVLRKVFTGFVPTKFIRHWMKTWRPRHQRRLYCAKFKQDLVE